jgi:hypothetical protein
MEDELRLDTNNYYRMRGWGWKGIAIKCASLSHHQKLTTDITKKKIRFLISVVKTLSLARGNFWQEGLLLLKNQGVILQLISPASAIHNLFKNSSTLFFPPVWFLISL